MNIEIRQIAGALGAEVLGVDLRARLSSEETSAIRAAWLQHLVLFFRDQHLTHDQYMAFARTIGLPVEYPFIKGIEGYPEIIEVKKLEHETVNFGGVWHSDTAYLDQPPMASMLLARIIPPFGGDTLFANMYLAFETLSDGMKHLLAPLRAVNSSTRADRFRAREDQTADKRSSASINEYLADHPVVRTHPETGRKALYVNVAHTAHFVGMTEQESEPLLYYLYHHQTKPEFTCRFSWQQGSLAIWDNRCAQHNPVNDYHGFRRVMERITLAGERPA